MLKDVSDSRRTNNLVHEQTTLETRVDAMVVSEVFWPTLKNEKFKLPEPVSRALNSYSEGFTNLKANRTLEWKEKLGLVELTLDLADREIELNVTPAQATVILAFQDQSTWTVDALSRQTQMTQSLLGKRLAFWVSHGVLHECAKDTFTVVEEIQYDPAYVGELHRNTGI
jgi:anaphase-promoting complex subunit 2